MAVTEQGVPVRTARPALLLAAAAAALVVLCALSIAVGNRWIPLDQVIHAFTRPDDSEVVAIVRGLRVPRTALGLLAGAGLGLSGALMQAMTRNPLGDPGLFGVTAGAAFGIVAAIALLGLTSLYGYVWFAFLGALLASALVYLVGSVGRGGTTPVKLALAGVAVSALLGSFTAGLVLRDPVALNRYRFWSAGSLAGQDATTLLQVVPFLVGGLVLAFALAPALNSLALGDDVATALGRKVGRIRLAGALAVTLLTGAAVTVAGPIIFIGLVIPHIARMLVGPDHRWLLPLSALLAPILLLAADVAGRVVLRPQEVAVGVVTAILGAPFFIALVRRRKLPEL